MTSVLFLAGCGVLEKSDPAPVVVTPDLYEYGEPFRERMATELETLLGRQCPREWVTEDCSALWTFTIDSIELRDKVRAARTVEDSR